MSLWLENKAKPNRKLFFGRHGGHGLQYLIHLGQGDVARLPCLPGHLLQRHVRPQLEQPHHGLQAQELQARGAHPRQPDRHLPGQPAAPNRLLPVRDVPGRRPRPGAVPSVQHAEREQRGPRPGGLGGGGGRVADLLPAAAGHRRRPPVGLPPQHVLPAGPRRREPPRGDGLRPPGHVQLGTPVPGQEEQQRGEHQAGRGHADVADAGAARRPCNYPGA